MVASKSHTRVPNFVRSPAQQEPLLEARGLTKKYQSGLVHGEVRAVDQVWLQLWRGEIVALVGESGCGKSTLGRLLLGLEAPDSGQLLLDGAPLALRRARRDAQAFRRRVQMVLQDPFASLNPVHSVSYHLSRPLRRHGLATRATCRQHVHALLGTVGLTPPEDFAASYPHALSGGQRQRVAIARALATRPELIVADEPTSMLDVSLRVDILNLLCALRTERGLSLLLITHDLASARYVADRVVVLYAGRVVEDGPIDEVITHPAHPYTELLVSCVPCAGQTLALSEQDLAPRPKTAAAWACPFAPRCPRSTPLCHHTAPARTAVAPCRWVACHHRLPARPAWRSAGECVSMGGEDHA